MRYSQAGGLMSIEDQIIQIVTAVMPANADIRRAPSARELSLCVDWALYDDPERPNKRSKTIEICVTRGALSDFESASVFNQSGAGQRFRALLALRFAQFDATHCRPMHEIPPVERWIIDSATLAG